ncbi:AAA family ATPase [Phlyctema vagabunda]|uniref:AAA family ATPase n=1 Tax=Phlyctema vagabunda TaxID=108571 RepID=A0ABR4PPM6_9HELO
MKLEIEPLVEDDSTSESEETNESSTIEEPSSITKLFKCEVREYEARFNLKGEKVEKLVDAKTEADDNADKGYVMSSHKTFGMQGSLIVWTIEIYSPHIQKALRQVIQVYPSVSFEGDIIILNDETHCIFHYRRELEQYRDSIDDRAAKLHIHLLLRFMERELRSAIRVYTSHVETATSNPSIEFQYLWMVFRPGELIIHGRDETEQIMVLVNTQLTGNDCNKAWSITGKVITHDGTSFGYTEQTVKISTFAGSRLISKLPVYPLNYHQDQESLRAKHKIRGEKFCSLRGSHHKFYQGVALALGHELDRDQWGQVDKYPVETKMVNSRVIIDSRMFGIFKAPNRVKLTERKTNFSDSDKDLSTLTKEDLIISHFRIPGFSLYDKKWCWFSVEMIQPVLFNEGAFDTLLLPRNHKDLVHALVKNHGSDDFDDLIKGKGKGLVVVLHGEPGVGKTFTAESIADQVQRPLYVLNSGELGVTPESVEANLNSALTLATSWNAIVLIDEADVFLEQRTIHDLTRNCLVSLFLRVLEYYQGILFLTTNRLATFDLAFKSRIHLSLKYTALDETRRKELWKLFLGRVSRDSPEVWDDKLLVELSKPNLNGRQIKNTVRTANTLALATKTPLSIGHLQSVLETIRDFDSELSRST